MKIVLCTHRFLPRFTGGVEIYTLRLARSLQALGHQVHVIAGELTAKEDLSVTVARESYRGVRVLRLFYDYSRRSAVQRASYSDPMVTAEIKALVQELQPDLIHATSFSLLMAGTIEAAAQLELPLVYTATDFVLTCRRGIYLTWDEQICAEPQTLERCAVCVGPHTRLERLLSRAWQLTPSRLAEPLLPRLEEVIGKKADFVHAASSIQCRLDYLARWQPTIDWIIAPSSYMRDMLALNGFPPERITVSPYGVEMPADDFRKIPVPTLRLGFIGRITPIKGIHTLIEAFTLLGESGQIELTIYGGVDTRAEAYAQRLQVQAAGQPGIRFAGPVDNADITYIYSQLDLLVVPSIWPENSPITILEAQAHGIPIIASDVGGIADVVRHEVNGLIFAKQDAADLAAQIRRCLASPALVEQLAKNSRLVQSIEMDAHRLVTLYRDMIRFHSS